jgi:MFS family permease
MSKFRDLKTFLIVWFGQAISTFGTAMTRFALLIWAYKISGQATTLALLGFFSFAVYIVMIPVAGVWVDRLDRKRIIMAADAGAGFITLLFLLLYSNGNLQIWHLYAGEALTGLLEAFQHPAYNASVSVMVPRDQLSRASGLRSLSYETTNIIAPMLAALLLRGIGLSGIMLIDFCTMCIAVAILFTVRIPRPESKPQSESFWQELTFGMRYIWRDHGLFAMTVVYMLIHLFACLTWFSILPAMILARSGGDELVLSYVQSALGVGGVVGSLLITIWGGPKRKIHGILATCGTSFLFGDLIFALGQTPAAWIFAAFAGAAFIPTVGSSNSAIWQSKVPHDIQGRVFGASFCLQQLTRPLGYLLAGPLADRLFEPAMMPGGSLTSTFGGLVGTGAGTGMAVMFLFTAIGGFLSCWGGYLYRPLREIDTTPTPAESLRLEPAAAD